MRGDPGLLGEASMRVGRRGAQPPPVIVFLVPQMVLAPDPRYKEDGLWRAEGDGIAPP